MKGKPDLKPSPSLPTATACSLALNVGFALNAFPHSLHVGMVATAELNPLQFLARFVEFTEGQPVFGSLDANGMFKAQAPPRFFGKIRSRHHGTKIRCHRQGGFADQAFAYGTTTR